MGSVMGFFTQRQSQQTLNAQQLFRLFRLHPWLKAVVHKIAFHVATVPLVIVKPTTRRGRSMVPHIRRAHGEIRAKLISKGLHGGDFVEMFEHPILDLLDNPNPMMSGMSFRRITQAYLDIKGESFWSKERVGSKVTELWPISPAWVMRIPEPGRPFFEVTIRGTRKNFPTDDMVWMRDINPEEPYGRGVGIAESLADELETDEWAAKMIKQFFRNGARPDIIVTLKGAKGKDALEQVKAKWDENHRGFQRAYRPMFTSGDVDVKELQKSFKDMDLVKLRGFERDAVINVFGIPPEILGLLDNSNRATASEARRIFASEVIFPRMAFLASELDLHLARDIDDTAIVHFVSPIPEDKERQLETMKAAPWAADRGEWRERMGLRDRGEGDRLHFTPLNLLPQASPEPDPIQQLSAPEMVRLLPGKAETRPVLWRMKLLAAPKVKTITEEELEALIESLQPERIAAEALPVWNEEMQRWGEARMLEIGLDVTAFNMTNPLIVQHLADFGGVKIVGINETTKNALRGTLGDGIRAGEGIPALSKRVSDTFDAAKGHRAVVIARTEVVGSSSFASRSAYEMSGIIPGKQWLATGDDRTRDTHDQLDGVIVATGQEFQSSSGATAQQPGGFGVGEEDVQCRCDLAPVTDESDVPKALDRDQRAAVWKLLEAERTPWETATMAAFRRAFTFQEEQVIRALELADES